MYYFLLIVGVIFNVVAQVFLKMGVQGVTFTGELLSITKMLFSNFYLWVALISYGIGFMLYALVLSRLDLSRAYPIASILAIILTVSISIVFMHEDASLRKIAGIGICLIGILVVFE